MGGDFEKDSLFLVAIELRRPRGKLGRPAPVGESGGDLTPSVGERDLDRDLPSDSGLGGSVKRGAKRRGRLGLCVSASTTSTLSRDSNRSGCEPNALFWKKRRTVANIAHSMNTGCR